jgi:hypothetical protein
LLIRQVDIKMNQLQIGKDRRVELQIPPSLKRHFKAAEENLRLVGESTPSGGKKQISVFKELLMT